MSDSSPIGQPVVFRVSEIGFLQSILIDIRTGQEVQSHPEQDAMIMVIQENLNSAEENHTLTASFREDENSFLQQTLVSMYEGFDSGNSLFDTAPFEHGHGCQERHIMQTIISKLKVAMTV